MLHAKKSSTRKLLKRMLALVLVFAFMFAFPLAVHAEDFQIPIEIELEEEFDDILDYDFARDMISFTLDVAPINVPWDNHYVIALGTTLSINAEPEMTEELAQRQYNLLVDLVSLDDDYYTSVIMEWSFEDGEWVVGSESVSHEFNASGAYMIRYSFGAFTVNEDGSFSGKGVTTLIYFDVVALPTVVRYAITFEDGDVHITEDNVAMIPLRFLCDELGADVEWHGATRSVTITLPGIEISLTIGDYDIIVNGEVVTMRAAPFIEGGRTFAPFQIIWNLVPDLGGVRTSGYTVYIYEPV